MQKSKQKNACKINKIEVTTEKISGRGGLAFFLRYVEKIRFYELTDTILGHIKISSKGMQLYQFTKQMLAFFIDGTNMSMSGFDDKKKDSSYAVLLENKPEVMGSSHQIKRFFRKLEINKVGNVIYRKFLHQLFIWRLQIEKPKIIILGIDTMVMDNNDAEQREGVEPTYKKKKGYQPLHISWSSFLVDIIFRNGKCHSNHGTDFIDTVTDIVTLIRENYVANVPIILVGDSGFLDNAAFNYFEDVLKIGYVVSGKMYNDIKDYISEVPAGEYKEFNGRATWNYYEFGNRLGTWEKFRRIIFTTLTTEENGQFVIEFERPDNIIYSNIGQDPKFTQLLIDAGRKDLLTAHSIIDLSHRRGKDELIHRSIKELATKEQLPFEGMEMNRGYYYFLAITHFLFEAYKRDVTPQAICVNCYPNTFRRKLIDFAVKIVKHGGVIILKVTNEIAERLDIYKLWEQCQNPPVMRV